MGLAMEPSLPKGALRGGALSTDALGLGSWKNWLKVTQVSPTSKLPAQGSFHTRVPPDCPHHAPAANDSHSNLLVSRGYGLLVSARTLKPVNNSHLSPLAFPPWLENPH